MFGDAKWVWASKASRPNERVNFFFDFELSEIPAKAEVLIGCETKYWLFVNGEVVVFDGGLFRESTPKCGYYDTVDVSKYLQIGDNSLIIHVWYYGNGGRNNNACQKAGLIVRCDALGLFTDEGVQCYSDSAYYIPKEEPTSHLYGGDHTAYDSRIRPFSLCPIKDTVSCATVVGAYGDEPWGMLVKRTVPQLFFTQRVSCNSSFKDNKYTVDLPYAMHFSPYIKVSANGGEVIDIRSDRFEVNGGPGDTRRSYRGHRAEYVCSLGEQEFEMLDWIFGEKIIFSVPETVKVLELGYRESGYDSKVTTEFECDNDEVNLLFSKCVRTLKVCMRENYMDCPDRERGQWIGDVSVQAPQVVYLLDGNGLALLRKAIYDFIGLRKGDRLVGNVPGDNFSELPSQSLNAISEWGMIATYYRATGDDNVLNMAFEPAVRYLSLWETDCDGVVTTRQGNWEWYDHLFNCDKELLNICWYYSALRFAQFMADKLENNTYDAFINERMNAIERVFNDRYWKAGGYYASGEFVDDRANAMAVLSGLCEKEKYPKLRYLLMSVFNSTPYMENYVLIALCEMGCKADAFRRMMCRYYPLINNENSTLWEDFFHLGTRNHAWSGGPATVLLRYFVGVNDDLSLSSPDDIYPLNSIKCSFVDRNGDIKIIER